MFTQCLDLSKVTFKVSEIVPYFCLCSFAPLSLSLPPLPLSPYLLPLSLPLPTSSLSFPQSHHNIPPNLKKFPPTSSPPPLLSFSLSLPPLSPSLNPTIIFPLTLRNFPLVPLLASHYFNKPPPSKGDVTS